LHLVMCCVLTAIVLGMGCQRSEAPLKTSFETFGTTATISVAAYKPGALASSARVTEATARRIMELLSVDEHDSEISALNRVGGTVRLPISLDTRRLLKLAMEYCTDTDEAFSITTAPVAFLWGFHGGITPREPVPDDLLKAALQGVGRGNIRLYENSVQLASPFTRGMRDLMIQLGNCARVLGDSAPAQPWQFTIADPRDSSRSLGQLSLAGNLAVAFADNSGDVGKQYGKIIDPRTGWPARRVRSVTVIAPTATKATALARALFVLGLEECTPVLARFPRCGALFISDGEPMEIWTTPDLRARFQPATELDVPVRVLSNS